LEEVLEGFGRGIVFGPFFFRPELLIMNLARLWLGFFCAGREIGHDYHFVIPGDCFVGKNCYLCGGTGGWGWFCHRPIPTGKWERCRTIKSFYGGKYAL